MELLEQVEAYLARNGMPPSTFGRMALGDPRFVDDLRSGRRPRPETQERVCAYLISDTASQRDKIQIHGSAGQANGPDSP